MEYTWIKESGELDESEVLSHITKHAQNEDNFIACSTDSFRTGHGKKQEMEQINVANLLELRLFSANREVCYRRSSVGNVFQWRLADETELDKSNYQARYQTLDINQKRTEEDGNKTDSYGNKILYTTGGGRYLLPLDGNEDSTKIIVYILYDENGMAKAVDYRVCGFVKYLGEQRGGR